MVWHDPPRVRALSQLRFDVAEEEKANRSGAHGAMFVSVRVSSHRFPARSEVPWISPHSVPQFGQFRFDSSQMVALDFDPILLDRSPCSAARL
ncbi:hypothetical protein Poly41_41090 [Novipirellula artificiosorum]|uniref:Uncharacterized protein n=1 Tax=Novipirellula artificiosorum TaxID=2528016 RepID=A0A5C6DFF5_9BACT|nr:hypothetical protein Poly41_41090 [Novipirellula artificiosorum]